MEQYKRCQGRYADGTRCTNRGTHRFFSLNAGGRAQCLCDSCAAVRDGYTTENAAQRGAERKMNDIRRKQTFSIELEMDNPKIGAYGNLGKKQYIPSSDCTVDVEFKSPIYTSGQPAFAGLKTIQCIIDAGDAVISERCGTHFHVGLTDNNGGTDGMNEFMSDGRSIIGNIRRFYQSLFCGLSDFLTNLSDGGAEVFGRSIHPAGSFGWANAITMNTSEMEHRNFINVQHDGTLEFRQCKFISAQQYARAMRVCRRWHEISVEFAISCDSLPDASAKKAAARAAGERMITEYRRAIVEGLDYDKGK